MLCPNCKNLAQLQKDPYGSLGNASEKTVVTSVVGGEGREGKTGGSYLHSHHHEEGEVAVAAGALAVVERDHHHTENLIRTRNEVEIV